LAINTLCGGFDVALMWLFWFQHFSFQHFQLLPKCGFGRLCRVLEWSLLGA
jgi:hypothetical protein